MNIAEFNNLNQSDRSNLLEQCCASSKWFKQMAKAAPFNSMEAVLEKADKVWSNCKEADFLEAFLGHPKIGDVHSLAEKYKATKKWAGNEQELVQEAVMEVLENLAKGNTDYENKFGFIFIVFATGKTANQMLALLLERLPNERSKELLIAAAEQHKITRLRIQKLLA